MDTKDAASAARVEPIVSLPGERRPTVATRACLYSMFRGVAGHRLRDKLSHIHMGYWNGTVHREDADSVIAANLIAWLRKQFPESDNIKQTDLFLHIE